MSTHSGLQGVLLICAVLMVAAAGCTVPSASTTTPPGPTAVTGAIQTGDATFLSLYDAAQSDIAAALERMNRHFPVGAATRGAPYLAGELRSSALDLQRTADAYHTSMIKIGSFQEKEKEYARNEYLKYLSSIRKVAGNTAEAAGAEMDLQFGLAQNFAEAARNALKDAEETGGTGHRDLLRATGISLDDYIQKMREKRV
jgi:hypothetical protein